VVFAVAVEKLVCRVHAEKTISAVKKWLFKPYIYNGEYVEMESDLPLHFPVSK
jgi:hypothetical protein